MSRIKTKIGVIIPSDASSDSDFWKYVPESVTLLFSRISILDQNEITIRGVEHVSETNEIELAAKMLKVSRADVIAYACTSGSFLRPGLDVAIAHRITRASEGIPAVTTSFAFKEALKRLGVKRIGVLTPYPESVNEKLRDYLLTAGFEVASFKGLGLPPGAAICDTPVSEIYRLVKSVNTPDAEAIFVSCTDYMAADIIARLEKELRKPVVTANQATIWKALEIAGVRTSVHGVGRLLELSVASC